MNMNVHVCSYMHALNNNDGNNNYFISQVLFHVTHGAEQNKGINVRTQMHNEHLTQEQNICTYNHAQKSEI